MNIGDLICFNSAGQREKTLGLVLDLQTYYNETSILVQWCIVGNMMPRRCWTMTSARDAIRHQRKIIPGDVIWHPRGDWFEKLRE